MIADLAKFPPYWQETGDYNLDYDPATGLFYARSGTGRVPLVDAERFHAIRRRNLAQCGKAR